jgi:glycosyltransferase involved in cell wall biosynthesis
MKILFVTFLYEPSLGGGASQVVHSLANGLSAQGHEVVVITSARVSRPVIEYQDNIKILRFYPQNLYWIFEKESQPSYKKILWQLIDLWNPWVYSVVKNFLKIEQPDVVHVHKLRGLSPSVWNAAKAAQVPLLVHTCHDYELVSPEGLLQGRIGKLAENRALIMRPYQTLRANISSLVQFASAPSQQLLSAHQKMAFFREAVCQVIPNSHGFSSKELAELRSKYLPKPFNPLRLLFFGRLVQEKGIEQLCQAVTTLNKDRCEVVLEVAGWGDYLLTLKERYANCENIHFHGAVFGDEKKRLLQECHLLVLPSLVPESFGIVIAEAYAYGKPVIASRIGAIPQLVTEGETGIFVSPGNVQELIQTIRKIADSRQLPGTPEACFDAARAYAMDVVQEKYLNFYRTILPGV